MSSDHSVKLRPGVLLSLVVTGLAGCAAFERQAFDLSGEPARAPHTRALRRSVALVVGTPQAVAPTAGDRVVVRAADGSVAVLPDVQWSDLLPNLLRRRLIDALLGAGVAAGDSGASPLALVTDIRRFEIDAAQNLARAELAVRLVDTASGGVRAGEVFIIETPAPEHYGAPAVAALSTVAAQASERIATWARARI